MRIKIIIPNASKAFLATQVGERRQAAGLGVDVDVICLNEGPVSLEGGFDEALIGPPLLALARGAEQDGYDAIVIDCAMDPALRAVRELVNIPVTSAGESALLYALGLGDKISVVTVLENTARVIGDRIRTYGLQGRVASIRFADVPVLELENTDQAGEAILSEARKAIDNDGADVIVLGCTGMSPIAAFLQERLEVPVVDPAVAALTMAESLVRMRLSHSKKCYLTPPKKEIVGKQFKDWGI